MASSFGGTVKLTGESEYIRALKNINSNLRAVSSEIKLTSTEFSNNGNKLSDLRAKNDALNKKYQEEQNIIKTCSSAIKSYTDLQTKNKSELDKLKNSLDTESKALEKMKNSTTASNSEISKQEKIVADLEKELGKAKSAYDSNNQKINDYKTKLNSAKTESSSLSKEIKNNEDVLNKLKYKFADGSKSVKEFATEETNAGRSTLSLADIIKGNLISEGIIAGIKGLASAMKTFGSAMIDAGKQAVSSYANYEQLIGGVQTLFKGSSSTVENYANNAYKTAGLSANEYMNTVTSFSASLLQSLGNDTSKSAEYANGAIVDMADNANKMGTSMEMIQNAYQGFAKQNYTMLDNLKLGYGGTKTEMERLIADANSVKVANGEMANLSINSFADVTEAIHIIQTEMGITGTTSKEANETISGSLASTQSAWQNLLTGLANGNADLSGLMQNLVDGIMTTANNILPVVQQVATSIVEMIPEVLNNIITFLPQFLETGSNILTQLITGLTNNMPLIVNAVMQIVTMLTTTIIQNLPQILKMGIKLVVSLVQGIAKQLPTLIPQMIKAVVSMVTTLLDNIDLLVDAGIQLLIGLADGLINALPDLIDKIPVIIDKLILAITNNLPKLISAGITLTIKLSEGLIKAIPKLVAKIPKIMSSLIKGIASYYGKLGSIGKELLGKVKNGLTKGISGMADIGKNVVKGLWNGINNAKDWVLDKIKGFGKSVLKGIKKIFGINSPSTVFRDEVGVYLAKGIGVGFQNEMKDVNATIRNSLPTDFDLATNVNIRKNNFGGGIVKNNNNSVPTQTIENNTYNIYSLTDSPGEIARHIRKERQYQKLANA